MTTKITTDALERHSHCKFKRHLNATTERGVRWD
jgi:hypothetical protein